MKRDRTRAFKLLTASSLITFVILMIVSVAKPVLGRIDVFSDIMFPYTLSAFGASWFIIFLVMCIFEKERGLPEKIVFGQIYYINYDQTLIFRWKVVIKAIPVSKNYCLEDTNIISPDNQILCYVPDNLNHANYTIPKSGYYIFYENDDGDFPKKPTIGLKEIFPPQTSKKWYAK